LPEAGASGISYSVAPYNITNIVYAGNAALKYQ